MSLIKWLKKGRKLVGDIMKESEVKKKYPKAVVLKDVPLMARTGTYKNKFPEGIIVHFTAGWRNQKPKDAISYANKKGHRYIFIAEDGTVVQQFDLSGYGPHAGISTCPVTKRSDVARLYIGIEVACGGRLEDADKDGQVDDTYFKLNVPQDQMRTGKINNKWQKSSGTYEIFTPEQEKSLIDLCVWLCQNGTNPDLIFGHDEVAPSRKNDPGLSLSMTMDEFRKTVKDRLQGTGI